MKVNKPKAPAKSADLNATAKESGASLKFNSPEIRVGLSAANKSPKMPKDKKVVIKTPKGKKPKM